MMYGSYKINIIFRIKMYVVVRWKFICFIDFLYIVEVICFVLSLVLFLFILFLIKFFFIFFLEWVDCDFGIGDILFLEFGFLFIGDVIDILLGEEEFGCLILILVVVSVLFMFFIFGIVLYLLLMIFLSFIFFVVLFFWFFFLIFILILFM